MHWDDALLHCGMARQFLCEKPAAMNAAEAVEMQAAARAAGLALRCGTNFRFKHQRGRT